MAKRLGEAAGEVLVLLPAVPRRQRHDHVHALAAREQREVRQSDVGKVFADVAGGLLHVAEIETLVRVEVEDHPLRRLDRVGARGPGMELDRAHLHALQDAAGVGDIEVVLRTAVLLADRHVMHRVA